MTNSRRWLTGRLAVSLVAVSLLVGTSWTGRAAHPTGATAVDPTLRAGDVALLHVIPGSAASVATTLEAAGASEVRTLDAIGVVTTRVTDAALAAIATDPRISTAASDVPVSASGGGKPKELDKIGAASTADSLGPAAIEAPEAWKAKATGAGVVVALMDSGIAAHPDLPAGKVVARLDFVKDNEGGGAKQLDPAGHGTHLAGVIAGHGTDFSGVAPDARLMSLRVLDRKGDGRLIDVLQAFDWLLKNRNAYQVRVLNLSFGAPQATSYHKDLLSAATEAAWFAGITVVAAAGNDGPDPSTVTTPGSDPFVITAGSFDDQGTASERDDAESVFSSRGPTLDGFAKPDVLAPGRRVVSLRALGSELDGEEPGNGAGKNLYVRMSGTSVASAMVAGVAALVLSKHPDYSPTKVKGAIVASGRDVTGSPRHAVDAPKALHETKNVNGKLAPSRLLLQILTDAGIKLGGKGVTWEGVTWERGVAWEKGVAWERGVAWEKVSAQSALVTVTGP